MLPPSAQAVSEEDLLPVDQAYVLSAKAVGRERVEFTWKIAPGYYLYRHRFGAQAADAAFTSGPLQLPPGKKHTDEFFGEVETYRKTVTAVLTGAAAGDARRPRFKVKYQGCADVGICYPPQTRTLTVTLPASVGGASAPIAGRASGLKPLLQVRPIRWAPWAARPAACLARATRCPRTRPSASRRSPVPRAELLVRLTPAPGYYLYRDKTSFKLTGADGVSPGRATLARRQGPSG